MTDTLREALEEAIEFACAANHHLAGCDPEPAARWRAALAAAPQPEPTGGAVVSVPKTLLLAVLEEADADSHAVEHEFGGDGQPHRDRIAGLQQLAAAPQPAPDREELVRLLRIITRNGSLDDGRTLHEIIADALLARGLRLPGAEELAAAYRAGQTDMKAAAMIAARDVGRPVGAGDGFGTYVPGTSGDAVAAISRLPIRVVEGGDDAA